MYRRRRYFFKHRTWYKMVLKPWLNWLECGKNGTQTLIKLTRVWKVRTALFHLTSFSTFSWKKHQTKIKWQAAIFCKNNILKTIYVWTSTIHTGIMNLKGWSNNVAYIQDSWSWWANQKHLSCHKRNWKRTRRTIQNILISAIISNEIVSTEVSNK